MPFFDSKSAFFAVDSTVGGTLLVSIGAYVDEINGLPGPRNLNDVTSLADAGNRFIPGLQNSVITVNGHYDSTGTGPDDIFGVHRTGTATMSFKYAPAGSGTGTAYTGEAWVTNYDIISKVGAQIRYSVTLQVDGTITRGAA